MLHNLGTTASEFPTSPVVDEVTTCNDDMKCVNEAQPLDQRTAAATSLSTTGMNRPTTDSPSVSTKHLSPSGRVDVVDHANEGSSPAEQGASRSRTESAPELVQQTPAIEVSTDVEPLLGEERREVDLMHDDVSGAPAENPIDMITQEPESITAPLAPESESEQRVNGNDAVQPEEMSQLPVSDHVLDSPVSKSETVGPDVSKAEDSSSAAGHHVLPLGAAESNATGEKSEPSKIPTDTPLANASELHAEVATSITPPEPSKLEAMSEPSTPDISEVSNATEQHIVSAHNEAAGELREMGRDLPLAHAAGMHVDLAPSIALSDSLGLKVPSDPASTVSASSQSNSDPVVPSIPTASFALATSGTTSEEFKPEPNANATQAKILTKAEKNKEKNKQKKARQKQRGKNTTASSSSNDKSCISLTSSPLASIRAVPEMSEMQGASDFADSEALDSTLPDVEDDCSGTEEPTMQENAAIDTASPNAAQSVPPASQETDNAGDHASATPRQDNQALPATSSDPYKPELSPASKDASSTSETQQNGPNTQIPQSDSLQTENEIGLGDEEEQNHVPDSSASGSSSTDTPPAASNKSAEDSSDSQMLPPLPESSESPLSTSEMHQNDSTTQISQSDSLQTGNQIEAEDVEEQTVVPDASASGSSSMDAPPATPRQTTERSPNLQPPILESSESTGEIHHNDSTIQIPPSDFLLTEDLVIDLGYEDEQTTVPSFGGSSSGNTPRATPHQTRDDNSSSESSEDAVSTSETHLNGSTAPIGILIELADVGEQAAGNGHSDSGSSSMNTPFAAPRQMTEGSPTLPPIPDSSAAFDEVFDLFSPAQSDIPTDGSAIPAASLSDLYQPLVPNSEAAVSPTRTLFPSVPQVVDNTKRMVASQNPINHAKAAELGICNQELENEHNSLVQLYEELKIKYKKLETEHKELQKYVEDRLESIRDS
jgi:hypothetical protein